MQTQINNQQKSVMTAMIPLLSSSSVSHVFTVLSRGISISYYISQYFCVLRGTGVTLNGQAVFSFSSKFSALSTWCLDTIWMRHSHGCLHVCGPLVLLYLSSYDSVPFSMHITHQVTHCDPPDVTLWEFSTGNFTLPYVR